MSETNSKRPLALGAMALCALCFGAGFFCAELLEGMHPEHSVLSEPLLVVSESQPEGQDFFLPPGTTLVYVPEQLPKGGTLYKTYIRVEGRPFDSVVPEASWPIHPLQSYNPVPSAK